MDWTKIPTTLISQRFSDYELACIVKFQLIWAMNEEEPDKQTALRYMTAKQYEVAMTYRDSILSTVVDEVSLVVKKRKVEKIRYNKNKRLKDFLPTDCQQSVSSLPEQIREDKIRLDKSSNNPPISPLVEKYPTEFEEFWKSYTPIQTKDGFVPKGNKQIALKSFIKARKEADYATIISGLEKYLRSCQTNDRLTKQASTWLNQRGWEDDYGPNQAIPAQGPQGGSSFLCAVRDFLADDTIQ